MVVNESVYPLHNVGVIDLVGAMKGSPIIFLTIAIITLTTTITLLILRRKKEVKRCVKMK